MNNVLCLKWGTLYPAEYVNRLYRGVKAHLHRPFRFVCVTDDSRGFEAGIEAVPFPEDPHVLNRPWPNIFSKLCLFKDGFANLEGPTLFLDIDQVIMGDLDCFFDYKPGEYCVVHNWIELRKQIFRSVPKIGNSTCFRFEAGKCNYVYERFLKEKDLPELEKLFTKGSQKYQTRAVGLENTNFWPDDFVRSFKRSCTWPWPLNHLLTPRKPKDGRILSFHGNPSPDQAIAGYRGKHLNTWTKPATWLKELWNY